MSARAVLDALRAGGPMTGTDLMAATGINRSTVHEICNDLIQLGWIQELDPRRPAGRSRRGRRARVYEFDADAGRVLGIVLAPTKVTACLADLRGGSLAEVAWPLPARRGAAAGWEHLGAVHAATDAVLAAAGARPDSVLGVGVAVRGPVHGAGDLLPGIDRAALPGAVARSFGWPVLVGGDTGLAALAERWQGAAAGVDDFIVILAGERFGAGIFTGGRPVRGHGEGAGALRLLDRVEPGGGDAGIAYLLRALGAKAVAGPAAPKGGVLRELAAGDPGRVTPELVLQAARAGDALALAVVDRVAARTARAITVMAAVLDPELVVLGGALATGDLLVERISIALAREDGAAPPRVAVSPLGDRAVSLGAVRLALDFVESNRFDAVGRAAPGGQAGGGTGEAGTREAVEAVDQGWSRPYSDKTIRRHAPTAGGERASIKDVAALARVSPSTVSVVLNDVHGARVADDTRRRVFAAADELGYTPDPLARGLRTRRSNLIGFVSDDIATTPYAGQMIQGAQDSAWKSGLLLVLVNTGGDADVEQRALRALAQRRVDGIVYATMFHRVLDVPRLRRDMPMVLLDAAPSASTPASARTPFVAPDEVSGAVSAVTELLGNGHRRIGFATLAAPGPATDGRLRGYAETLAGAGIAVDADLIAFDDSDALGGYHAVGRLLDLPDRPTAVFCFNDEMAMGAYRAAAARGLRIPEDLSVVGYDDHALIASSLSPGLTTVALPHYEMGVLAMETLLAETGDLPPSDRPRQTYVHCPLVRRGSVRPPPGAGTE